MKKLSIVLLTVALVAFVLQGCGSGSTGEDIPPSKMNDAQHKDKRGD